MTITRGREHGMHYLRIADDGEGVPRDAGGAPAEQLLERLIELALYTEENLR